MDKEFIPYEQALALKEFGFDEPCIAQYSDKSLCQHGYGKVKQGNLFSYNCITPLYQQAFRWFRENHNIEVKPMTVVQGSDKYYNLSIVKPLSDSFIITNEYKRLNTYEEAELACLKKLIEITKEKNNG